MEWIERLNSAVEYMEAHLLEKIDYEQIAAIANCSAYHFQRMFFYMTNISVSEYIRRRRMSLAAVDLQEAGAKVIDIALKYGYESPTVGKSCPLNKVLEENFTRIPHEWDMALENGTLSELYGLMNGKPEGLLGVSVHNEKEWKYFIAVSSTENSDKFEQYDISAAAWAVFSGRGTNVSLQELERRVITEWLPVVKKEDNSGRINNQS